MCLLKTRHELHLGGQDLLLRVDLLLLPGCHLLQLRETDVHRRMNNLEKQSHMTSCAPWYIHVGLGGDHKTRQSFWELRANSESRKKCCYWLSENKTMRLSTAHPPFFFEQSGKHKSCNINIGLRKSRTLSKESQVYFSLLG